MTMDAIKPADILDAICRVHQCDALMQLQVIAGVDADGVAEKVFAGFNWQDASFQDRQRKILEWIKAARAFAGDRAGPFTVEHYAHLHFLMKALEDLGFSQHLPKVMDNARDAMKALRDAYPMAEQYAQSQKRKLA